MPTNPETLRERIAGEPRFAPASGHFWPIALGTLFTSIAAFAILIWRFGLRDDASVVGTIGLIGFCGIELAAGVCLVYSVIHGSHPGRQISLWSCGVLATTALALHLAIIWLNFRASPIHVPEGQDLHYWKLCVTIIFAVSLPLVALGWTRLARTQTLRPHVVGGMVGLGAGLLADAIWRLSCDFSDPRHVLSHTLGILLAAAVGLTWGRWQILLWRRKTRLSNPNHRL